jgi:OmcA/MtrC family decaheme c-type cytochrome
MIAGATSDYSWYRREDARSTGVFDATAGTTTYTFTNAIPEDAKGTWTVTADLRRAVALKRGDGGPDISVNESTINPIKYFALDGGTATPRRTVVTLNQCNQCHDQLSLHGGQRNTTEECVICHNPLESDTSRRPANAGAPESISFQRMVHRIHTGHELTQDYTVYGFGNNPINFNHVGFPGIITNCTNCHLAGTYFLPIKGTAEKVDPRGWISPVKPTTAACVSCHASFEASAHALANTSSLGESCAACHGEGKDFAVSKVHAQ